MQRQRVPRSTDTEGGAACRGHDPHVTHGHEPLEASRMDGASSWQVFRDVVLPLLKPVMTLAILLRTMDLMRIFDQIFILTQGGPGFATETVSLYIYRTAFRFFNFGYAAAMSFLGLGLTIVFARSLMRVMRVSK
jgi:multiple sugar transport system permease protein